MRYFSPAKNAAWPTRRHPTRLRRHLHEFEPAADCVETVSRPDISHRPAPPNRASSRLAAHPHEFERDGPARRIADSSPLPSGDVRPPPLTRFTGAGRSDPRPASSRAPSETPPGPSPWRPRFPRRRRRTPAPSVRARRASARSRPVAPDPTGRRHATSRISATSPSGWRQPRPRGGRGDDRVQPETADRNIQRRQRAEDAHVLGRERHFLVRLAQGGALERFARLGDATRQRDLAAMTSQRVGPDRQHDVGVGADREHAAAVRPHDGRAPDRIPAASCAGGAAPSARAPPRRAAAAPGRPGAVSSAVSNLHGGFGTTAHLAGSSRAAADTPRSSRRARPRPAMNAYPASLG